MITEIPNKIRANCTLLTVMQNHAKERKRLQMRKHQTALKRCINFLVTLPIKILVVPLCLVATGIACLLMWATIFWVAIHELANVIDEEWGTRIRSWSE